MPGGIERIHDGTARGARRLMEEIQLLTEPATEQRADRAIGGVFIVFATERENRSVSIIRCVRAIR